MDGSSESLQVLVWMLIGLTLLSSEAFTGHFHLLFMGLAAFLTAVLASLGLHSIILQSVLFSVVSLSCGALVHERMRRRSADEFALGDDAEWILEDSFLPDQEREILYRGAPWRAVNRSGLPLSSGDRVRVLRTEGMKLILSV